MNDITYNEECVHVVFLGLPNVPGIAAEIFGALSAHFVEVSMVTQNTMRGGRSDLSFLIPKERHSHYTPLTRCTVSRGVGQ